MLPMTRQTFIVNKNLLRFCQPNDCLNLDFSQIPGLIAMDAGRSKVVTNGSSWYYSMNIT